MLYYRTGEECLRRLTRVVQQGKVSRGGAEPLTACQLSAHLANEGSKSCSDQTEKGEKEKRAALKLYVQGRCQGQYLLHESFKEPAHQLWREELW